MSQSTGANPLAKHFRQPALYIGLTSRGAFWPEDAISLPATGEIPIFPMTARDEITLRTPDALLNGTAVVTIIESCCPNISNAWAMPSVDADMLLIAIRIASYGPTMTVSSRCPACGVEHDYDVDLRNAISQIRMPDYNKPVLTSGLEIYLKPLDYRQVSAAGQKTYEEERFLASLSDTEVSEEDRRAQFDAHIQKMIDMNLQSLTDYTGLIVTNDGVEVTNPEHIKEFYNNTGSDTIKVIQDRIAEHAKIAAIPPMDAACDSCQHQFKLDVTFDYSSFFAAGS